MVRHMFIDVESTGDGSNLYHGIVEISARYYENWGYKDQYNAKFGHDSKNSYQGGVNFKKAQEYSQSGKVGCDEGIKDFIDWLDNKLGDNRAFFIAYNCEWDWKHVMNWFKRNKITKKYFLTPCICVMSLCACKFDKFLSLHSCAEKLGIEVIHKKLHSAKYDVLLTSDIHRLITSKIRD